MCVCVCGYIRILLGDLRTFHSNPNYMHLHIYIFISPYMCAAGKLHMLIHVKWSIRLLRRIRPLNCWLAFFTAKVCLNFI